MAQYDVVLSSDNQEEVGTRRPIKENKDRCGDHRKNFLEAEKNPLDQSLAEKGVVAKRHMSICSSCRDWRDGRETLKQKKNFFF